MVLGQWLLECSVACPKQNKMERERCLECTHHGWSLPTCKSERMCAFLMNVALGKLGDFPELYGIHVMTLQSMAQSPLLRNGWHICAKHVPAIFKCISLCLVKEFPFSSLDVTLSGGCGFLARHTVAFQVVLRSQGRFPDKRTEWRIGNEIMLQPPWRCTCRHLVWSRRKKLRWPHKHWHQNNFLFTDIFYII